MNEFKYISLLYPILYYVFFFTDHQEVNLWLQLTCLLFNTFLLCVLIVFVVWRFYVRDVVGDGNDNGNPFDYDWFHEIIAGCIFISIYTISGEPL